MLFTIILCALTGILIYYQVFTQGLFSSLIMLVASLVAAVTALNYYEPLAALLNDQGMGKFGPKGIALVAIFTITLLVLREASDRLIKGNMNFPLLIDRLGSGVFALISSLIITGMVALGMQNMPISATLLQFDRCGESLDQPSQDKGLFPYGDTLVLGLMNQVSVSSFAGAHGFKQHHPDWLREMYLNRLQPDNFIGSRREASSKAVIVDKAWVVAQALRDEKQEAVVLGTNEILVGVRIRLVPGSGERGDRGAKDVDGKIRFTMGQVRLVGFDMSKPTGTAYAVHPLGLYQENSTTYRKKALNQGHQISSGGSKNIDLLFKWPAKLSQTRPLYLEFKGLSRAEVRIKTNSETK